MAPTRRKLRRPAAKKKAQAPGPRPARDSSTGSSDRSSSEGGSSASSDGPSDEDDPRDYKHGGYHPVMPYQLYSGRYRVLSKLGAGAFSTVWLCADERDQREDGPDLVAMKVCKSKKSVTEQAEDEVLLLERLESGSASSTHVTQMRGHFWHSGPNGRHKCMVFEVMGENLLALVKHHDYNGLPLPLVRRLARHTLSGLEYIHSRGVIHTDVKLENVLVQRHDFAELLCEARRAHRAFMEQKKGTVDLLSKTQKKRMKKKEKKSAGKAPEVAAATAADDRGEADPEEKGEGAGGGADADQAAAEACGRPVPPVRQRERFDTLDFCQVNAKLADFGNGCLSNRKVTDDIQTRQYRSPEVIIGTKWDETADVWSAACMIFELATGDFLFDPHADDGWSRDEDHLALMTELLGDLPPREWALSGKYSKDFFNNSGKLKHIKSLKYWALVDVLKEKYSMSQEVAREISDFLSPMLSWEPRVRQSAREALKHPWVQPAPGDAPDGAAPATLPSRGAAAPTGSPEAPAGEAPAAAAAAAAEAAEDEAPASDAATPEAGGAQPPFAPPQRPAPPDTPEAPADEDGQAPLRAPTEAAAGAEDVGTPVAAAAAEPSAAAATSGAAAATGDGEKEDRGGDDQDGAEDADAEEGGGQPAAGKPKRKKNKNKGKK